MENIQAYKGDLPYIFISYAHADTDRVMPLLKALQEAGYRIWFDQGIEAGTEWSNNIAEHLSGCSAFLFFTSPNSVKSENCLDEVAYAKSHNKQALLAYLEEDVILPAGTEMQTARFQRMYVNRQPSLEAFVKNFSEAVIFDCCRGEAKPVTQPVAEPATQPVAKPATQPAAKPAAQPKQPENKPAKKGAPKGLLIGAGVAVAGFLAVALLVVILLVALVSGGSSKPTPNISGNNTVTPQETIELSNSLQDFTFRLNGVVYQLPVPYSTFKANGWTIDPDDATEESYIGGLSDVYTILINGKEYVWVTIYNNSEDAKPVKDCTITKIELDADLNTCIAAGITPDATEEAMVAAFGAAERNELSSSISLTWEFGENSYVEAHCNEDADYSYITLVNMTLPKVETTVNENTPAYLADYQAPTALGTDLYSGILSVDGALYELPVPLREFLNNGWAISAGVPNLASGNKTNLTLSKNGNKITVEVTNLWIYKTTVQNCVVTKISATDASGTSVFLPGNIAIGMTDDAVKAAVPADMEREAYTYTIYYSYYDYEEREFYVNLSVDVESGKLQCITVENDPESLTMN